MKTGNLSDRHLKRIPSQNTDAATSSNRGELTSTINRSTSGKPILSKGFRSPFRDGFVRSLTVCLLLLFGPLLLAQRSERAVAPLGQGGRFLAVSAGGAWGIAIRGMGTSSAGTMAPLSIDLSTEPAAEPLTAAYREIGIANGVLTGRGELATGRDVRIIFEDHWRVMKDVLRLQRRLTVHGSPEQQTGFTSGISLEHTVRIGRNDFDVFAPGMVYGSTAHLTASAIGGSDTFSSTGKGTTHIREDRMPAPLYGVRFHDGSTLAILDQAPDGATTIADAHDTAVVPMTDDQFAFGAVGGSVHPGHAPKEGFWFPGSEGEVTYRGNTYPGGQEHRSRYRYHPLTDGAQQHYDLSFRFSHAASFPAFERESWRWAFACLAPAAPHQDIAAVERGITDVLATQAVTAGNHTGLPNAISSVSATAAPDDKAIIGFTGKNLESAELLLAEADRETDPAHAARDRETGLAIFRSFIRLPMAPPVGEGFYLATGAPALAIPEAHCVFLRSFSDGLKSTMRAYLREKDAGREHPEWLAWSRSFADWLLTQQSADGAFPRSWKPVTGEIFDRSPQASYNPIPLLVLLSKATGDPRYATAAIRAGEFTWKAGQLHGQFVGGTIDNPDILDKEAGTLSLEAYLALYESTHDRRWVDRASAAADYAESYIYLWNVPMVPGEDAGALHWKPGASTVGTQLIATGHSLVDEYMSFDVDSYARLYRLTGDAHYRAVAQLLLHGTKAMIATPEHPYDLRDLGWQQEHWSLAPVRGFGLHRMWLPWVATSQLKGIIALREYDPAFFAVLTGNGAAQ